MFFSSYGLKDIFDYPQTYNVVKITDIFFHPMHQTEKLKCPM